MIKILRGLTNKFFDIIFGTHRNIGHIGLHKKTMCPMFLCVSKIMLRVRG